MFMINLIKFLPFLFIVCLNTAWIFPKRLSKFESLNENQCVSYSGASIFFDIVILIALVYYGRNEFREIMSTAKKNTLFSRKFITHFHSVWNLLDTFVLIVGFLFCFLDLSYSCMKPTKTSEDTLKMFASFFFFSSWLRLLEYARGIKSTSTLIRMLTRIMSDMKGFFLVFFFLIIGNFLLTINLR